MALECCSNTKYLGILNKCSSSEFQINIDDGTYEMRYFFGSKQFRQSIEIASNKFTLLGEGFNDNFEYEFELYESNVQVEDNDGYKKFQFNSKCIG